MSVAGVLLLSYSLFFHKDKMAFFKAKGRDNDKKAWCDLNHIRLIVLNYNESEDEWRIKFD